MITRTLCNAKESIDMCFNIVVVAVETLLFLFYFPLKYNNDNNTNCKSTKRAFPLFTFVITVIKTIQSIALCSVLPISPLLLFLYVVYSMLGAVLFPLQTVGILTPFVSGLFLASVSQHLFLGALFFMIMYISLQILSHYSELHCCAHVFLLFNRCNKKFLFFPRLFLSRFLVYFLRVLSDVFLPTNLKTRLASEFGTMSSNNGSRTIL